MSVRPKTKSCLVTLLLALLSLASTPSRAATTVPPLSSEQPPPGFSLPSSPQFDLDGDSKADGVSLLSQGCYKTVSIRLGNQRARDLDFTTISADLGVLVTYDIDHDSDRDLIWISSLDTRSSVVWINEGKANFTVASRDLYAAQLRELQSGNDPSQPESSKIWSREKGLTSSKSSDHGCCAASQPNAIRNRRAIFVEPPSPTYLSLFLNYLRLRGPPSIVL